MNQILEILNTKLPIENIIFLLTFLFSSIAMTEPNSYSRKSIKIVITSSILIPILNILMLQEHTPVLYVWNIVPFIGFSLMMSYLVIYAQSHYMILSIAKNLQSAFKLKHFNEMIDLDRPELNIKKKDMDVIFHYLRAAKTGMVLGVDLDNETGQLDRYKVLNYLNSKELLEYSVVYEEAVKTRKLGNIIFFIGLIAPLSYFIMQFI